MYDAELIETKKKVDAMLLQKDLKYLQGYEQGRADAFNEILNEMRKSPFASDKATFVKRYIEEQLKEQNNESIV